MASILEIGTANVIVISGKHFGSKLINPTVQFTDADRVLLTARVVPEYVDDARGPQFIFPAFSQPVFNTSAPGFLIHVCEIDRRPAPAGIDISVIVDWAIVHP